MRFSRLVIVLGVVALACFATARADGEEEAAAGDTNAEATDAEFAAAEAAPNLDPNSLEAIILKGNEADALSAISQLTANPNKIIPRFRIDEQMKALIKEEIVEHTELLNCSYLHLAAVFDFADVVKQGLAAGADKDGICQMDGHMEILELSPLKLAAYFGAPKSARALIDAGAKLTSDSDKEQDYYPLLLASDRGHAEIVKMLLAAGAPVHPSEKSPTREAALHYAVINGFDDIVDLLLQAGADVNFATSQGDTALHAACWIGNLTMVKKLLENNANTRVNTTDGLLPIDLAREQDHAAIVALIDETDKARGLEPSPVRTAEEMMGMGGGMDGGEDMESFIKMQKEFEELMAQASASSGDSADGTEESSQILDGGDEPTDTAGTPESHADEL